MTLSFIAFNRYCLIAHSQKYIRIFTRRNSVGMCVLIWIIAGIFKLPTLTGWSKIKYNPKTNACSYARDESKSYHYLVLSLGYGIPLIAIIVSYTKLYLVVKRSRQRVALMNAMKKEASRQKQNSPGPDTITTSNTLSTEKPAVNVKQKDMKLTQTLVIIFMLFLLLITPYALLNMVDNDGKVSRPVHITVTWIMFLNCAVNPILYAVMNPHFREAYQTLLCARCGRATIQKCRTSNESTGVTQRQPDINRAE